MNKAPDAFRTISEVADELDLPQHVLRFWESRFPHIKPLKRGGGRRYYRPDDIDLLRGIRRLLYADGYTIRGVQRILREQGVRTVQLVGQGQEVPSLATVTRDGNDDRRNGSSGLAEVNFLPPPNVAAPDGAQEHGDAPDAYRAARPQNGPMIEANVSAIHPVAVTPVARQASVQVDQARAAVVPVAAPSGVVTPSVAAPAAAKPASVTPAGAGQVGAAPVGAAPVGAASVGAAPVGVTPAPVATLAPHMAAQDLDRLKQALAELEACRRLLDKAHEGGP